MKRSIILVLWLVLIPVMTLSASAIDDNNLSKVIVQGEGKASRAPDMVTIVLGVETRNASASIAAQENAKLMNETINALIAAGINKKEIQTSHYSLTTKEEEPENTDERQKPPEFIASNLVTIKLNDTENVSRALDAAVTVGSNHIQEVAFDLKNPQPEKDIALALAIQDAMHKAEVAAKAADMKLIKVLEISEDYGFVAPAAKNVMYADGVITPIQSGELQVSASVTMTYEVS